MFYQVEKKDIIPARHYLINPKPKIRHFTSTHSNQIVNEQSSIET